MSDLERQVIGALRSTIEAHGPITKEQIGSAAKRIAGQLTARTYIPGARLYPDTHAPELEVG